MRALLFCCLLAPALAEPFLVALHFNFKELPTTAGERACSNILDVNFGESDIVNGLSGINCTPELQPNHEFNFAVINGKAAACLTSTRTLGFFEQILLGSSNHRFTCYAELKPKDREFKATREGDVITVSIDTLTWTFNRHDVDLLQFSDSEFRILLKNLPPFRIHMEDAEAIRRAFAIVAKAMDEPMVVYT